MLTGSELVEAARDYALEMHAGLVRPNKKREPYSVHTTGVAALVEQSGGSSEEIAAGHLHDTLEDTKATREEIRRRFGDVVATLVEGLTDPSDYEGMPTLARKTLQAERVRGKSTGVKRCKLADTIHNLLSVAEDPPVKWDRQKCLDYIEGARRVGTECLGISPFLDAEFHAAHASALANVDQHYPTV